MPKQPQRFYQREIKRFVPSDCGQFIHAAELSCGHIELYQRRRRMGSKRTAMPCSQCGFMPRIRFERERDQRRMDRLLRAAVSDEDRRAALILLCDGVVQLLATHPVGRDQRRIWDELIKATNTLELRERGVA